MMKGGKGGANTKTGLTFESRIEIKTLFRSLKGYTVQNDDLFFGKRKVATFYKKHDLYKKLLAPKGVDYTKIISKKLLPDDAIFVLSNNTVFIIEMKFQETPGSVDEKLQTCDFKNRQYKKLLTPLGLRVKYTYVLNDWFKKPEYRDVLAYINEVECFYFFETVPLTFLGLSNPES